MVHSDFARAFELAVLVGATDVSEVKAWIDRRIAEDPRPSPEMIDLSLAPDRFKVLECLSTLSGDADLEQSSRIYFRFLFRGLKDGSVSFLRAARHLSSMAGELSSLDPAFNALYSFDDDLELAEKGVYGTVSGAKAEIMEFLLAHMTDDPPELFPNNGDPSGNDPAS